MSETKRVPTWGEIFKVQAAIEALSGALAELGRIAPIVNPDDGDDETANSAYENERAVRYLQTWTDLARLARESEDLERKKAGLS
jgi:hypothetical protein